MSSHSNSIILRFSDSFTCPSFLLEHQVKKWEEAEKLGTSGHVSCCESCSLFQKTLLTTFCSWCTKMPKLGKLFVINFIKLINYQLQLSMIFSNIHFKHVSLETEKLRKQRNLYYHSVSFSFCQCTTFLPIKSCAIKFPSK